MNPVNTYIKSLPDWQMQNLEVFRKIIHKVEPSIAEDWKWGVPIFMFDGKVQFAMSAFKAHTKFNFMKNGAFIADPNGLFNNGLNSKRSRSIDLREDETINKSALKALIETSITHT